MVILTPEEIEAARELVLRSYLQEYGPMEAGCWNWTGRMAPGGYGIMGQGETRNGVRRVRTFYAHRESFEQFVGPIPEGFEVDHLCRNPSCVNPTHLEAVTPAENKRRANAAAKARRVAADSQASIDKWRKQMKTERLKRNLTQAQASEALGIPHNYLGFYETGMRRVSPGRRAELLAALRSLPAIEHAGKNAPRDKPQRATTIRPRLGA